jgi:hypothetical protein
MSKISLTSIILFIFYCNKIGEQRVRFAEPVSDFASEQNVAVPPSKYDTGNPPTQEDESKETANASTEAGSQTSASCSNDHQKEDLDKSLYNAMRSTPSFDSASIGSKENTNNTRAAEEATLEDLIKDGKMDYDYISTEATGAEGTNLTPQEQQANESAATSAASNLAHEGESKAGFHTTATYPLCYAQYPPLPNPSSPWPWTPTVIYQFAQTNINVQVNQQANNNTVNQVDLSTTNHVDYTSTINHVDVSNITNNNTVNQDATSNTINHIDVANVTNGNSINPALLTPLPDTPCNSKDVPARSLVASPRKSQIRFCPRSGQERDLAKNGIVKAMHLEGAKGRVQDQRDISAQKKREQIGAIRKRRDIEMRSEAEANKKLYSERHSRRVRSDQADDGQSKYSKVEES